MKKIIVFLTSIVIISSFVAITYAALVVFYKDDSRLQVGSGFNYDVSFPDALSEDKREFIFPSGSNPRDYTLTFEVEKNSDYDIYFAVFYDNATLGIESITGGARGLVVSGVGTVNKDVTVNINSTDEQSALIGLILITEDEYNDTSTQIYDSINEEYYDLIGN